MKLSTAGHRIYELEDGLLLVYKPRGYRESVHEHPYAQRVRVIRGRLHVEIGHSGLLLDPTSAPLLLSAGEEHSTKAVENTWLVAERIDPST
jgi:hypothetical protein